MKDAYVPAGLIIALLLAGFVSLYASPEPDGLERVAEDYGFTGNAEGKEVLSSPMADYIVPGISNEQPAGSLAGIIGAVILFVSVPALGFVLKKPGKGKGK